MSVELPHIHGPRDMPDLRRWMERHFAPSGAFGWLEEADFIAWALPPCRLWWVEPEACDVLAESAPTFPGEHRLEPGDLPSPQGLVVFARDLVGMDAAPQAGGKPVNVSAIIWSLSTIPELDGEKRNGISLLMFSRIDLADREHPYAPVFRYALGAKRMTGTMFAYIGRTDWVAGWEADRPIPDNPHGLDPHTLTSMAEDRRLIASLWALARTPIAHVDTWHPPRPESRRAQRRGLDSSVRVLTLPGPTGESPPTTGGGTRQWRHRWVVRPHWVNQPCGPGMSERKLILRGPFWKGPEGAPAIGGERVWKIVPPPDGKEPDDGNES